MEVEQPGFESVLIWNTGLTGSSFSCYTTMLALFSTSTPTEFQFMPKVSCLNVAFPNALLFRYYFTLACKLPVP